MLSIAALAELYPFHMLHAEAVPVDIAAAEVQAAPERVSVHFVGTANTAEHIAAVSAALCSKRG